MNATQQKVLRYLDEAHAGEQALVSVLQSQIAMAPRGSYRSGLESHLDETRDHAARVGRRLQALGQGSYPLSAVVGLAESVLGRVLAVGKAPLNLLRGSGGPEKVLEGAKDACASESLEIANYTAIERLARSVGDDETARLAASIRADEQKMLERILREIPELTEAVVRAGGNGKPSGDVTVGGAANTVREASKPVKNAAREASKPVKNAAREASKPVKNAAREASKPAKNAARDTTAAAKRPARQGRRASGVTRADERSPAGAPARANGAGAVLDAHQELQAAAAAGDGAAAFTLWERLRDVDFAAAEGWLRTAVELGDVRAAHRRGMLLWERRDVDAAEETLRRATADPEGAYALGRLLWRERSDAEGAVHWLDRAAQADDPEAERDLGIVLREHGDLQGAHYWLSRAAERDGEAREVLAALDAGE